APCSWTRLRDRLRGRGTWAVHSRDELRRRGLHAAEYRRRIDAEPHDAGDERNHHSQLTPVEIWNVLVLRLVERIEQNPLNGPQQIRCGDDHRRRGDERQDRLGPERTDEHEELAHESIRSRHADAAERYDGE